LKEALSLQEHTGKSLGQFNRAGFGSGIAPATDHLEVWPNFGWTSSGGKQVQEECEETRMPNGNQTEISAGDQGADGLFLEFRNIFAAAEIRPHNGLPHEPRFGAAEIAHVIVKADRDF
jgi:hypothetical protein